MTGLVQAGKPDVAAVRWLNRPRTGLVAGLLTAVAGGLRRRHLCWRALVPWVNASSRGEARIRGGTRWEPVALMTRRPGPPRSGPAASAPAPATKVAPRQSTHLRDAALAAAAGLAGFGAAPLLGHPGFELPALLAGVGCGAVVAVTGERTKRRRDLEDRVLEAAAPLLCVRHLDRRIVKMTRWTSGWPGLPRRVRMHYAPGAPDNDPAWTR